MNIISGLYNEGQIRVGIVATRFNEVVVSKLVDGAADGLSRHGVDMDTVDLAWVPGAFEVPLTAKKMAESGKYDAILCLGAVIRGERKELPRYRFPPVYPFFMGFLRLTLWNRH